MGSKNVSFGGVYNLAANKDEESKVAGTVGVTPNAILSDIADEDNQGALSETAAFMGNSGSEVKQTDASDLNEALDELLSSDYELVEEDCEEEIDEMADDADSGVKKIKKVKRMVKRKKKKTSSKRNIFFYGNNDKES